MTEDDLAAIAQDAAAAWGMPEAPPALVHRRENAVYRVRYADGRDCALRLHRPGYHNDAEIGAELALMERLADAAFPCPWPQRMQGGGLVWTGPGDRLASAVQWLDGAPIDAGDGTGQTGTGQTGTGQTGAQPELFRRLGALLADLHLTADAVGPEPLQRPAWDAAAFCGPDPLWGRYWENRTLVAEEADLLLAARDWAAEVLEGLPDRPDGTIHGDVLPDNVLSVGGELFLIDFDDCGPGWRAYDLATALVQHVAAPGFGALRDALVGGYAAAGGPASDAALTRIDLFVMLRALASAGWTIGRLAEGDARHRAHASRAVHCAERVLSGTPI